VDAHARAVECTARGAQLNGLTNVTTELNASGHLTGTGGFHRVLANPPYYAHFRIAAHFLEVGCNALQPGGDILLVTKQPDWYAENMTEWFDDVTIQEAKGYYLVSGRKPAEPFG
jgi:16S rRNA (guanine1207-N2)-methyltransferase